ncbi:conserved Plasmodium protein, unknown function [Plasmodium knowlesi strain H]|uniref:Uncharacterized protein n=3 Tax=Plasmodium knowlesi TaxID=5850 RepID=A0A1A7VE71_PLAKH|nr:conserved Plasmodium protein, unknown function [Plasmodium knowlesi strain H]OTN64953.1 Uncharacterized protein PKNOH_S120148600 [Plasmodium knowlesi]CAA9988343.1 conserved Plasmodium protein, unknown function [Plasmodium knowlesi strain H]SBO20099.1 conserved Plasmodium protein, unknown function [Plasmodium knowlesi strain H]SBO20297.1 conserved Plasmodium protein, unknown function [Plasmodium knowlesi strain H]VVS77817.1 conserved Plasmodium protein, unknown function [Plasmodium knowlesi 
MEESHVEPFILFEGENNVNSDNFCYEYKAKSIRKGLSRTQSYRNLSSRSRMSKWACKNGAPFNFAIWEITPRCSSRFAQLKKEKLDLFLSLYLLQSDLGMIGKHNLDDFLYNEDQRRRRRDGVPMLWLHDSTATYSTSRTVQGGVKHK